MIEVLAFCPGGTVENSSPIYRWDESEQLRKSHRDGWTEAVFEDQPLTTAEHLLRLFNPEVCGD
jgi:hypothetical protein